MGVGRAKTVLRPARLIYVCYYYYYTIVSISNDLVWIVPPLSLLDTWTIFANEHWHWKNLSTKYKTIRTYDNKTCVRNNNSLKTSTMPTVPCPRSSSDVASKAMTTRRGRPLSRAHRRRFSLAAQNSFQLAYMPARGSRTHSSRLQKEGNAFRRINIRVPEAVSGKLLF